MILCDNQKLQVLRGVGIQMRGTYPKTESSANLFMVDILQLSDLQIR